MKKLHFVEKITDYGSKQVLLKLGNKILGYIEAYPKFTACEDEKNKYFYGIGKPNNKNFAVSYTLNTLDECIDSLWEIFDYESDLTRLKTEIKNKTYEEVKKYLSGFNIDYSEGYETFDFRFGCFEGTIENSNGIPKLQNTIDLS